MYVHLKVLRTHAFSSNTYVLYMLKLKNISKWSFYTSNALRQQLNLPWTTFNLIKISLIGIRICLLTLFWRRRRSIISTAAETNARVRHYEFFSLFSLSHSLSLSLTLSFSFFNFLLSSQMNKTYEFSLQPFLHYFNITYNDYMNLFQ